MGALTSGSVALAASTKIAAANRQGFRLLKSQGHIVWASATDTEGFIECGIAIDRTAAEIESAFSNAPKDATTTDNAASMAPVFPMVFLKEHSAEKRMGNSGIMPVVVAPRWSVIEGVDLKFYVRNISASTLTTGSNVRFVMKHFGVWLRD